MVRRMILTTQITAAAVLICTFSTTINAQHTMTNIQKAEAVLRSLQTNDPAAIEQYVNSTTYIQHNLSFPDGRDALLGAIQQGMLKGTSVNIKRIFSDDDIVVLHTEYHLFGKDLVGFDVFRFENGFIVEHWDNLQPIAEPNPSGHTMTDGLTTITDEEKTEENKQLIMNFINKVFIGGDFSIMPSFFDGNTYIQHNPMVGDGLTGLQSAFAEFHKSGTIFRYTKVHKVIAQGNFVLSMGEGEFGNPAVPTAFFDLFRLEHGKIVEHWDVIAPIPPKSEWANSNGKF